MLRRFAALSLGLGLSVAAPPTARALVLDGAPVVGFRIDRPEGDYLDGEVEVDRLRIHHCAGGYTDYSVSQTVDPVVGHSVEIDAGNHCGATWVFSSDLVIDGDGSLGTFTVESSDAQVYSPLSTSIPWSGLTPWEVTGGSMAGGGPQLITFVE